jgi:hypothetical protein
MNDHILSTAQLPARPGRFTPWEEYGRAIKVSRPWFECWQKTKDPRHLCLADACQDMAEQWLSLAHQQHQISNNTFKRESEKSSAISEPELA